MKRIITLISVCVVVAVFAAFAVPGKKSKAQPVVAKSEASTQTAGGFAFDPKD